MTMTICKKYKQVSLTFWQVLPKNDRSTHTVFLYASRSLVIGLCYVAIASAPFRAGLV